MIEVLLVEDDPSIRAAVSATLSGADAGMRVAAALGTAGAALAWLRATGKVDAALVDLSLPDRSGLEILSTLRETRPDCAALAFTVFDDDEHLFPALEAGAHGYLLKDSAPAELVRAIHEAVSGGAPMSPRIARRLVRRFWAPAPPTAPLTPRERELLALLCQGASFDGAALKLGVTLSTIQAHVRSVYRKLNVNSKAEAVSAAVRLRLFVP